MVCLNMCSISPMIKPKGHTLDLIISRSDDNIIKSVSVDDGVAISDHFWINADLNIHKPPLPKKRDKF